MQAVSFVRRLFGWLWRIVQGMYVIVSLLVFLFVSIIILASFAPDVPQIAERTALVIAPQGTLVDQLSGDPIDQALARVRGTPVRETLLQDLLEAIEHARDDERVKVLLLRLDGLGVAGLSKLQAVGDEILRFKESDKPVIAVSDTFTRDQYYLAAHADQIFMNPMGFVYIDGFSRFVPYYRAAIEKLLVDFHVWRVGEYKSFVEPILRDDMSEADRESAEAYLSALWDAYQADVTAARGLMPDALQAYADNAVTFLEEANGNTARLAVNRELVDELLSRAEIAARIRPLVDPELDDTDDFSEVGYADYLREVRFGRSDAADRDAVAVLVAAGTILDGEQPPGTVGGDSTAALIRAANRDESIKALVLRVDSPGGSAFASEVIRSELEAFQQSGRPLVVSMGSVAASGGYWISMTADEIWASPTTLTGSIGVGATLPTVPRLLDALGIHVDGIGTTALAGQIDLTRELGPDVQQLLGQAIDYSYTDFITKVAEHRDRDVPAIDAVARGRVWIADQALEHELIDRLGGLDDAIESAAELAGLEPDDYAIRYVERDLELAERIALELIGRAAPFLRAVRLPLPFSDGFQRLLELAAEPIKWVDGLNDPRHIYAYCFCDIR
jgi:protease-4